MSLSAARESRRCAARTRAALLRGLSGTDPADDVVVVGIDAEGIDVLVSGHPQRIPLKRPMASPADARDVLVEMAADVRQAESVTPESESREG